MGNKPFFLEWENAFEFVMKSWKRFESYFLVNMLFHTGIGIRIVCSNTYFN